MLSATVEVAQNQILGLTLLIVTSIAIDVNDHEWWDLLVVWGGEHWMGHMNSTANNFLL